MTAKEVLQNIEKQREEAGIAFLGNIYLEVPEYREVINALEKQIPRKIDNKDEADLVYGCHCCGEINALWKMNGEKNKYCGNCGQKIDWSEEK